MEVIKETQDKLGDLEAKLEGMKKAKNSFTKGRSY